MSFAHLYSSKLDKSRQIFFQNDLAINGQLFIKPQTKLHVKSSSLDKFTIDDLEKQIKLTKSNLRLQNIDAKGKEKLESLLFKYESEVKRRMSLLSPIKDEIKYELSIKQEEFIKNEPIEEAIIVSKAEESNPVFYVSDELLSKMHSLTIDPHKNKLNIAKKSANTSSNPVETSKQSNSSLIPKNNNDEKSLKFLSLKESTELVKQRKFIPKSRLNVVPDFSDDEDEDEEDENDCDDDDDDEYEHNGSL